MLDVSFSQPIQKRHVEHSVEMCHFLMNTIYICEMLLEYPAWIPAIFYHCYTHTT